MKKILKPISKILLYAFMGGVFALVISLTFQMLGRIFPGNLTNQAFGLVLFDIATVVWLAVLVFQSESMMQYGIAGLGFLLGLAGTALMVAGEVMLSAQGMVTPPAWLGEYAVYGFILAAFLHLVLLYGHHMAAPGVSAQIQLGAARAQIISEALKQAEEQLSSNQTVLAASIAAALVDDIKRDLRLPALAAPSTPPVIDLTEHRNGHHKAEAEALKQTQTPKG
jgi:hypothetical protein